MKITVTENHIAAGVRGRSMRCPIALALSDAGLAAPFVCGTYVCVNACGYARFPRERYLLPSVARRFVGDFDTGGAVEPFSFWLNTENLPEVEIPVLEEPVEA